MRVREREKKDQKYNCDGKNGRRSLCLDISVATQWWAGIEGNSRNCLGIKHSLRCFPTMVSRCVHCCFGNFVSYRENRCVCSIFLWRICVLFMTIRIYLMFFFQCDVCGHDIFCYNRNKPIKIAMIILIMELSLYSFGEISTVWWNPQLVSNFYSFVFCLGFEFSEFEPSALVQRQGGPCAVIAPVQAFLLKMLLSDTNDHSLSDVSKFCIFFSSRMCHFIYIRNVKQHNCASFLANSQSALCHIDSSFWHMFIFSPFNGHGDDTFLPTKITFYAFQRH